MIKAIGFISEPHAGHRRHKVHCDVTYPVQYTDFRHVWGLGYGMTVGWSGAYPCYQIGYCRPLLETISSTGCTFETWVYEQKNPLTGATIAWYPCRPTQVVIAYTVLGTTCASVETDESGPVAQPAGSIRVLANPTRHDVRAAFTIEEPGETRVDIYDVKGTLVRCIDCLYLEKGSHAVVWDGNDRNGRPVSPGVYFFQVTSIQGSMKAKVVRLR